MRRALRLARTGLTSAAGVLAAFLILNLGLTAVLFISNGAASRLASDLERLRAADQWSAIDPVESFRRVYGRVLGPNPDGAGVRTRFDRAARRGEPLVFDQAMAAYALHRYGQVDARVLPSGVYVGTRSIGPDHPPLVGWTKYLVHYGFFVRHSFVLVSAPPVGGRYPQAVAFSAGPKSDFVPLKPERETMYAAVHPYAPGEYDFPNEGQAIHELHRLSGDPLVAAQAAARLEAAAAVIRRADAPYRVVTVNSNTAIGCLLRSSGTLDVEEEASLGRWPIALRALGVGFRLPLPAEAGDGGRAVQQTRPC